MSKVSNGFWRSGASIHTLRTDLFAPWQTNIRKLEIFSALEQLSTPEAVAILADFLQTCLHGVAQHNAMRVGRESERTYQLLEECARSLARHSSGEGIAPLRALLVSPETSTREKIIAVRGLGAADDPDALLLAVGGVQVKNPGLALAVTTTIRELLDRFDAQFDRLTDDLKNFVLEQIAKTLLDEDWIECLEHSGAPAEATEILRVYMTPRSYRLLFDRLERAKTRPGYIWAAKAIGPHLTSDDAAKLMKRFKRAFEDPDILATIGATLARSPIPEVRQELQETVRRPSLRMRLGTSRLIVFGQKRLEARLKAMALVSG